MVKKVQKRGRPSKAKPKVKRVLRGSGAVSDVLGSGTRPGTGSGKAPVVSGVEPCLFPCPSLRRVLNDALPRMYAVRECKDEESGIRALGGEDLDSLQLELETLLSSVAVRLNQLNEQLTVVNSLEKVPPGRGRKQRNTRAVIPAPPPAPPPPPPASEEKSCISRPPVKAPVKKLGSSSPSSVPSPGFSHPPLKRSKIIRKRPDGETAKKPRGDKHLEKEFITHKFWNTLDPYCAEVTEESYNLLSDILCQNQTEVASLCDPQLLGEQLSKDWEIKDFVENQNFGNASSSVSLPSNFSTPPTNVALSTPTESIGSAIRRKLRECCSMMALKRTSRTSDKAPSSSPPTPATSKLMAALLGEIPPAVTPLQESKDHNVIVKVEKEEDDKISLRSSCPNSVGESSNYSDVHRKHQRRCLERKVLLDKEAQGDIESSIRDNELPVSLLEELKEAQAELKLVVEHNSRTIMNLTNIIIEEFKIQNLKRKLQEVDDAVIDLYHTRTAAKLAKQTITQEEVDQAWRALKERDHIIKQIDYFQRNWNVKTSTNHGRLKVKTTKEQEEEKRQKREQKVKQYKAAYGRIVEKRLAGEKDEEGLQISQHILEMIPDIHSLWNYRREILEYLKESIAEDELQRRLESERFLTETCLRGNPKSYGAWHHRHWVMDAMPAPDWQRELGLCNKFLSMDERNFHCWDYRRFVVRRAAVSPEQELAFTDEKLAVNFSNYSCWHYRSKLLPRVYPDPQGVRPVREDRHRHELELVQNAAFTDPSDQSAWFYQRWLLGRARPPLAVSRALLSPALSFVALSRPAPHPGAGLQFLIGQQQVRGDWSPADGQSISSVWVFSPAAPLPALPPAGVAVRLVRGGRGSQEVEEVTSDLEVAVGGGSARLMAPPEFGAPLSPALASVMVEELEACRQLLEFDPDSKWTLLTSVLLMQSIDRHLYQQETLVTLDELVELDFQRANYYKDLRSRLRIEDVLERGSACEVIDLSGLSLTALYHAPLLSLATTVNLSNNQLRRPLPQLTALQCCETLFLDGNEMTSLAQFGAMPRLRTLSLCNNALPDLKPVLAALAASCPGLQHLDLRGCPLARDIDRSSLRALPGLTTFNGELLV